MSEWMGDWIVASRKDEPMARVDEAEDVSPDTEADYGSMVLEDEVDLVEFFGEF